MAFKTPDVYVQEIAVFPPSVAEVGTAIPAFVGYTQKATGTAGEPLLLKPTRITSYTEYVQLFGNPPEVSIAVTAMADGTVTSIAPTAPGHLLAYSLRMFYDNGGGACYIVSVGDYSGAVATGDGTPGGTTGLLDGLAALSMEDEPTILVIPDAVLLSGSDYQNVVRAMLLQCGRLGDRVALMDVHAGTTPLNPSNVDPQRAFFGSQHLKYGAAYYPFVKTTLNPYLGPSDDGAEVDVVVGGNPAAALPSFKDSNPRLFNNVKAALRGHFVTLPPSGAVAGVYAATDRDRGVWKAPANVALNNVIEPIVRLDNETQGDLNVDSTGAGKSINCIRAFAGRGSLVWGARTLAGNDNEWRYISVRRFFNTVEESIKKSTYWAVFEPNEANTWVKVRGMIEAYLTSKWRDGALAGATTKDAFFVRCGLGTTMTSQDILEGILNVEIGLAVVRPAEFIVLKFSHKLQTS